MTARISPPSSSTTPETLRENGACPGPASEPEAPSAADADRGAFRPSSWWLRKFGPAFGGLAWAVRHQSSMWIHLFCAAGVLVAGFAFQITALEFTVLIFSIGLVITCELLNTAVEHAIQITVKEWHPLAKIALDVMAGAVLWSALVACCVALIVFGPHLWVRLLHPLFS